jgi:hypothetical protein
VALFGLGRKYYLIEKEEDEQGYQGYGHIFPKSEFQQRIAYEQKRQQDENRQQLVFFQPGIFVRDLKIFSQPDDHYHDQQDRNRQPQQAYVSREETRQSTFGDQHGDERQDQKQQRVVQKFVHDQKYFFADCWKFK